LVGRSSNLVCAGRGYIALPGSTGGLWRQGASDAKSAHEHRIGRQWQASHRIPP
jgi:hypothetical protein